MNQTQKAKIYKNLPKGAVALDIERVEIFKLGNGRRKEVSTVSYVYKNKIYRTSLKLFVGN